MRLLSILTRMTRTVHVRILFIILLNIINYKSYAGLPTYRLVGDNVDLRVHVRHQTISHMDHDHHWFNMYAIKDRIFGLHLPDQRPQADVQTVPLSSFLPNVDDCVCLHKEFTILFARVLIKHLPCFSFLQTVVPDHIKHQHSDIMKSKSEVVS